LTSLDDTSAYMEHYCGGPVPINMACVADVPHLHYDGYSTYYSDVKCAPPHVTRPTFSPHLPLGTFHEE